MNEKAKFLRISFVCFLFLAFCTGFTSCRSTSPITDQSVLTHQREVIELESRNRDLTKRLDSYDSIVGTSVSRLEDIGIRAAGMGSEIDELIYLFGQYQSEVQRLIDEYRRLQAADRSIQSESSGP